MTQSSTSSVATPRGGPARRHEPPPVTIADIAAEVGVSVATVSKVLNGRPDVSADTRRRVETSLNLNSYRRRPRRLRAGAGRIDLVFHDYGSLWSLEITRGVGEHAARAGADVVLSHLGGRHHPDDDWLDAVLARRPLGVLLVMSTLSPQQHRELTRHGIAAVVLDTDGATPAEVVSVGSNNWNGGLVAGRHLLGLGHRRIGVVTGPPDVLCSRARLAGVRSALEEARAPTDPALVRHGTFNVDAGYVHARDLLTRPDPPTALFAGSDLQAMGVLRAAHDLGLRVPEDLSVVGYDDLPVASWTVPALTTVHQPLRDMARTATRMLLDLARGVRPAAARIELTTHLVVRESTAPPRPRP